MSSNEEDVYKGKVVVASIKCKDIKNGKVQFNDQSPAGEKARFIKDVTKDGNGMFTATEIDYLEAKTLIESNGKIDADTTPLFCVHGFNVQPSDMLEGFEKVSEKFFEKGGCYYPIPVLWPCSDGNALLNYDKDQEGFSQQAGPLFRKLVEQIPDDTFPRKSLLMHSMGNHVVFNGACSAQSPPQVQFENIFMVAADVPFDIFHKDPNDNYRGDNSKVFANKKHKATNFFKMLARKADGKPKGKICIVHYLGDRALLGSSNQNWENRLGQRGCGKYKWWLNQSWYEDKDLVRSEIRNNDGTYYENYDVEPFEGKFVNDTKFWHSYQFDDFAVEYYNLKSKDIQM